jgi:hypothetical protein
VSAVLDAQAKVEGGGPDAYPSGRTKPSSVVQRVASLSLATFPRKTRSSEGWSSVVEAERNFFIRVPVQLFVGDLIGLEVGDAAAARWPGHALGGDAP